MYKRVWGIDGCAPYSPFAGGVYWGLFAFSTYRHLSLFLTVSQSLCGGTMTDFFLFVGSMLLHYRAAVSIFVHRSLWLCAIMLVKKTLRSGIAESKRM